MPASLAGAALGALAALAALGLPLASEPAPAEAAKVEAPPPARLLVTAREYRLTLSRPKLVAGEAIVQLYNFGEDPHDLRLRRVGARRVLTLAEAGPGQTTELETRLRRASRYRLWCSLPGHAKLGMKATLRTTAKTAAQRRKSKRARR